MKEYHKMKGMNPNTIIAHWFLKIVGVKLAMYFGLWLLRRFFERKLTR